jgi:hypothetical protein
MSCIFNEHSPNRNWTHSVSSPIVARQRLGKYVPSTTNTHNKIIAERVVLYAVLVISKKVGN